MQRSVIIRKRAQKYELRGGKQWQEGGRETRKNEFESSAVVKGTTQMSVIMMR